MTGTIADVISTLQEIKSAMLDDDDARFMSALDVASSLDITPEQVRDEHDRTIFAANAPFSQTRYFASRAYPNHS
jgi:hypothetical protein